MFLLCANHDSHYARHETFAFEETRHGSGNTGILNLQNKIGLSTYDLRRALFWHWNYTVPLLVVGRFTAFQGL